MRKQKIKTIDNTSIEVIEWYDAQSDDGWEDTKKAELASCITVGFLVAEDRKAICLASTWSIDSTNARMHIPKSWIKDRKTLSIKKEVIREDLDSENLYTNT
jgi:hypothetical protein